jgi:hypothetical protein
MSFTPNVVTIPYAWVEYLAKHPDKTREFVSRVVYAYEGQCAVYGTSAPAPKADEDLPLEPPEVPHHDSLREGLITALAAEFPTAQKPTDLQVNELYYLTVDQGASEAEAIRATLDLAGKMVAKKGTDQTSHIRLALIAMRQTGDWATIKDEADTYAASVAAVNPNVARQRENQRLATTSTPPPPPARSANRSSRIADILSIAKAGR